MTDVTGKADVTKNAQVIVVTSGKGGVGKTTTTAALGAALAQTGANVVVIDFDVGLRNLDLIMGIENRVVFDLINVIRGEAKLSQALTHYKHNQKEYENLSILPASQTQDKDALTMDGVKKIIDELKKKFDWIICDSPAGIEHGAKAAMHFADRAIIVTNPEVSSVRDSDRIIGMLDSCTEKAKNGETIQKGLLITRYNAVRSERGDMLSVKQIVDILSIPLIGIIPESTKVVEAANVGTPVDIFDPKDPVSISYLETAARVRGETVELKVPQVKRGIFSSLFGKHK